MLYAPQALATLSVAVATLAASRAASAQVTIVAEESFAFGQVGDPIGGAGSGSGWLGPWDAGPTNDFALLAAPSFDAIGWRAHLNGAAVPCYRDLDTSLHPEIAENGYYGLDGVTVWIRFEAQDVTQSAANPYFGGLSLFSDAAEELFIGVPWGTQEWGFDTHGSGIFTVAGSNDNVRTTLVTRIDFASGGDRLRLWLNPAVAQPTGPAGIDLTVPHFNFNRVRIDNGGSGTGANARFDVDAIQIARPVGPLGTNYCTGNPNSTGAVALISGSGSSSVASNDLVLQCSAMPLNAFGFFLTSQTQASIPNPGGSSGVLCLSGAIGRYVGPGQILNSGSSGAIALQVNLLQHPTPTGPTVVQAGSTWNFTCWFRDASGGVATSNFSNGLEIQFN